MPMLPALHANSPVAWQRIDAGEDGFVPYGCIVSEGKVPAVVGAGEVPVFAIIAPELLEGIGSPLRELLGSVCTAA